MKWPNHKSLRMVMAGVDVKAGRIFDLSKPAAIVVLGPFLRAEKVHWRTIQSQREAVSQALGRAAKEDCFQGIMAPSQQVPGGTTIVVFPTKLGRHDRLSAPKFRWQLERF